MKELINDLIKKDSVEAVLAEADKLSGEELYNFMRDFARKSVMDEMGRDLIERVTRSDIDFSHEIIVASYYMMTKEGKRQADPNNLYKMDEFKRGYDSGLKVEKINGNETIVKR